MTEAPKHRNVKRKKCQKVEFGCRVGDLIYWVIGRSIVLQLVAERPLGLRREYR